MVNTLDEFRAYLEMFKQWMKIHQKDVDEILDETDSKQQNIENKEDDMHSN